MGFLDDIKKSVSDQKQQRLDDAANPRVAESLAMAADKLKGGIGGALRVTQEATEIGRMLGEGENLVTMVKGDLDKKKGIAALTTRRIIFVESSSTRRRVEVFPHEEIDSLSMSGVVNIKIEIGSKRRKALIEHAIPATRPKEFVDEFFKLQASGPQAGSPLAAPSTPSTSDLTERLSNLAELHSKGVLDDDEFKAAKRKLIDD